MLSRVRLAIRAYLWPCPDALWDGLVSLPCFEESEDFGAGATYVLCGLLGGEYDFGVEGAWYVGCFTGAGRYSGAGR